MEQTKWKPLNLKRTDTLFFFGVAFVFLLEILILFTEFREENLRTAWLAPLIVAMMIYLLMRIGLPRNPAVLLPPAFALWHLLTRVINGDWYLHESHAYVYMVLLSAFVLFLAPFLASGEQRDRFLRGIALLYSVAFSVIAWIAVVAALTGHPWINPLDGNILGINEFYSDPYRLNILGIHPNISSIFFYTSLSLLIYLFFRTERIWVRIVYGAMGVGLYLAICMTGSISAILVTGVIIGLAVFALFFHSGKIKKLRILTAILAMLIAAVIVVVSYPSVIQWTTGIYEKVRQKGTGINTLLITAASAEENQQQETAAEQEAGGDAGNAVFAQERLEIDSMAANMGARFDIYSSAFLSVADRPITLIIGELWDDAMDRSARMINYPFQNHVHNSFLQTLVVGGGISFLMAIAFTVLLAVYGLRLFFRKGVPMHLRLLVLAPVGLLIHSMTEAILFVDTRLPNMLFFFLAGMIIAYASELCPRKEKQKAES